MNPSTSDADGASKRNRHVTHVTVMTIPIAGANGKIQNRLLVYENPPTKEYVLSHLMALHEENIHSRKENYKGEFELCHQVVQQVPETEFAKLGQGRSNRITHLIAVGSRSPRSSGPQDGRIFSARTCPVHAVLSEQ